MVDTPVRLLLSPTHAPPLLFRRWDGIAEWHRFQNILRASPSHICFWLPVIGYEYVYECLAPGCQECRCRNARASAFGLSQSHMSPLLSCAFLCRVLVGDGERAAGRTLRLRDRRIVQREWERRARAALHGAHAPRPARAPQNGRRLAHEVHPAPFSPNPHPPSLPPSLQSAHLWCCSPSRHCSASHQKWAL